jgi:NAD(P)-dependent dehydrogenase (short-subunit alcohol dehydrogenase family)
MAILIVVLQSDYGRGGEHMQIADKIVVVTGGASGIGRALCDAFVNAGAKKVVVADLNVEWGAEVANSFGGTFIKCDVSIEAEIVNLVDEVENRLGPIGIFCSNAGIAAGFETGSRNIAGIGDEVWIKSWQVNVMAHVYTARALIPRMIERGDGYFLNTVSAAGLLTQLGSAVYATTKHAAVGFAECFAIAHRKQGIRVSILCPQGVDTPMLSSLPQGPQSRDGVMSSTEVAAHAINGIEREDFLILPHPKVAEYMTRKVANYDRWLSGMSSLQERY